MRVNVVQLGSPKGHRRQPQIPPYPTGILSVAVSDSISLSDSVSELLPLAFVVSDTLSFLDTQTLFIPDDSVPSLYTDDLFIISDSIQVTIPSVGILTQSVSDTLNNWSDAVGGAFGGLFVAVADTLTFLDNWNYLTQTAADTINFWNDSMAFLVDINLYNTIDPPHTPNFNDSTLTIPGILDSFQCLNMDSTTNAIIQTPLQADLIAITDGLAEVLGIVETESATIAITDVIQLFGVDLVSVTDTITFSDFAAASSPTTPVIQPADFFTISDSIQLLKTGFQTPASADTLALVDQVNLALNQDSLETDSITITDISIENLVILVTVTSTLSLTDSEANNTPNLPNIVLSFGDMVMVSDFVVVGNGEFINVSDPFALVDGVGLQDEVVVALSPSMNAYVRRYLNDVVGVGNMGQGDN